jgi:hypothetical protein
MKVQDASELEVLFREQGAKRWEIAATGAGERIEKLKRLRDRIVAREPELSEALKTDFRKRAWNVDQKSTRRSRKSISDQRIALWDAGPTGFGTLTLALSTCSSATSQRAVSLRWNYLPVRIAPGFGGGCGNVVFANITRRPPPPRSSRPFWKRCFPERKWRWWRVRAA